MERPDGFEHEKRDCTVRALSMASNLPYGQVHQAWKQMGRKDKKPAKSRVLLQGVLKLLNLKGKCVKRTGSVRKFIRQFPKGSFYCRISEHAFPVVNGKAHELYSLDCHLRGAWLIEGTMKGGVEDGN